MVVIQCEPGQRRPPGARALQGKHELPFELLLAIGELVGGQTLAGGVGVFLPHGSGSLGGRGGLSADVCSELPRGLVKVLVGKDGVGEPQLFSDALKEPAGHAATKSVGQDSQGKAARIPKRKGVGTEDDVSLRGITVLGAASPTNRGNRLYPGPGWLEHATLEPAFPLENGQQLAVVYVSRRRYDAVAPIVPPLVECPKVFGRHGLQSIGRAQNRIAVRVPGPEGACMDFENEIVGGVCHPVDLLQHYIALGLEVALPE